MRLSEQIELLIQSNGIDINDYDLSCFGTEACCFVLGAYKSIVIDKDKVSDYKDYNTKLLHEFSHLDTGHLYRTRHNLPYIRKIETMNERKLIKRFIPVKKLESMLKAGLNWHEIAEEFGVLENLIKKSYEYYINIGDIK